ncbi:MAG: response regulator, partial [Algicola sp.]|nr:response regulator [Algicola sp.]
SQSPKTLISDGQRIEQILRNLLSNAVKFTETGSVKVVIKPAPSETRFTNPALKVENTVSIAVIDTGLGIPQEKRLQIFEAFVQQDGSTSRQFGGTGLGLTIARELSRLLGGEIQLLSQSGKGSIFTLLLPYIHDEMIFEEPIDLPPGREVINQPISMPQPITMPQSISIPKQHDQLIKPDNSPLADSAGLHYPPFVDDDRDSIIIGEPSLLIIDSDKNFAQTMRNDTKRLGYKCLVAGSGHSGIYLAQHYQPKGIILDINLPDINGHQVLEQLKFSLKTRHIPVEIITAQGESKTRVLQQGAIGLQVKPITEKQLQSVLSKISDITSSPQRNILIVEDDHGNRTATARLLQSCDLNITSVATGSAGCIEIVSGKYDCVILDLGLPDMTGFEVLKRVSSDTERQIPPIIVYTGKQISDQEQTELHKYASTIVIKGVGSTERLLDDISLFMHNIDAHFARNEQQTIARLHNEDEMLQGRKILLADDDMRNTYALSKKLIETGFDVEMANNGKEALELLSENSDFELVLMDIMMPVMDGNQATERIRQMVHYQDIPIIALTAKTMPEDREGCLRAGASEYITKPIDFDRLLSIMRIWLFKRV